MFVWFNTEISINNSTHTGKVEVSESTRNLNRHREKSNPTFPAAMWASKPLAIDLGVNNEPPLFGKYQTEPGSCAQKSSTQSRFSGLATHACRSSTVVINPCRLDGQELGIFVACCAASLVDVVLEVLREDTLPEVHKRMLPSRHAETNLENKLQEMRGS